MKPVLAPILSLLLAQTAVANVEKTIFLGPAPVPVPLAHPTLEDLHIDTLTPQGNWSLTTHLTAKFPSGSAPNGHTTWLLLDDLQEGQRYEVRVCWAATQPTAFTLRTYELSTVWDTPELVTSLRDYSVTRQPDEQLTKKSHQATSPGQKERHASVLFLEILAAADYFTTNATLMRNPPLVDVDIILDPFLFNVFPRSLLPTAGYIIVVAVAAFLASQWVLTQLKTIVTLAGKSEQKKTQ